MKKEEYIEKYGEEAYQKRLEQFRTWRASHKEQERQRRKEWYDTNKPHVLDYNRQYRSANRCQVNAAKRSRKRKAYCCEDVSLIENYELAKADNFVGWEVHHRLETHTSDGERRLVDLSVDELKALDMYYHRPVCELVYLRKSEHAALHMTGHGVHEK